MASTEKLYFTDSRILDFSATVIEAQPAEGGYHIKLDRTAFYPTGGGQPHDTGKLNDADVIEVFEDEAGTIFHLIKSDCDISEGQIVDGRIDRERRLDHLQQHSGQHILSQAFARACGAQTRSFHLGSRTSTIDIELQSATDDDMRAAEQIANAIVFEDRPVRVHLLSEEEAAQIELRKESAARGRIRVIEVEDFDWSPCGGTHATRTGEIGLIAVKSYERARKMTRVEFVCGNRALKDYRLANANASSIATLFSAERDSAPELVARAIQENKTLKKRARELIEKAATEEALRLLAEADSSAPFKIILAAFDGRDIEEVKALASKIIEREAAVALLATSDAGAARLVFARSAGLPQNVGQFMVEACALLGGRGGGKPDMAQGGGPALEKLDEALRLAAEKASRA